MIKIGSRTLININKDGDGLTFMAAKQLDGVNKTGVEGASPTHSGCPHVPLTMIRLGRKSRSHHEAIIIREIRMMMMSSNPNPTLVLMLLLMMMIQILQVAVLGHS